MLSTYIDPLYLVRTSNLGALEKADITSTVLSEWKTFDSLNNCSIENCAREAIPQEDSERDSLKVSTVWNNLESMTSEVLKVAKNGDTVATQEPKEPRTLGEFT